MKVEQFVHLLNEKYCKIDQTLSVRVNLFDRLTRINFFRQYLLAQHMIGSLSSSTSDENFDGDSQKAIAAETILATEQYEDIRVLVRESLDAFCLLAEHDLLKKYMTIFPSNDDSTISPSFWQQQMHKRHSFTDN
jgi:hypothetical protein